jgi:putative intracellular protease/amidase
MSRILIVLTSHASLGGTDRPTGYYVSEAAEPWRAFTAAGHAADLASITGGTPPSDGDWDGFADFRPLAEAGAVAVADVDPGRYDAVFLAGGHGTMWDFPASPVLARLIGAVYAHGGVVGAVCHGPAGLTEVTLPGGGYLIAGRAVAGFTDEEESAVGLTDIVPFSLQQRLAARGALLRPAPAFTARVVRDGRLVTGQNPASAPGVADAMLTALAECDAVAVTVSYFAAEHRRDLDGIMAHFAPAVRFVTPAGAVLDGTDAVRDFYAANLQALPTLRVDLVDDVSAGPRAALTWRAEGTTTDGATVAMHGSNIVTVEAGVFTDFRAYWLNTG